MTAALPKEGKTAVVDGRPIYYLDVGKGTPVVLLHGGGPGASGFSNYNAILKHCRRSTGSSFRICPALVDRARRRFPGRDTPLTQPRCLDSLINLQSPRLTSLGTHSAVVRL
jgi:pimeloyl-ACP methyl ester carboxylesterase